MRPGSVIVDLAAETGGNCALTRPGEVVTHRGVTVLGYIDLPSRLAPTASQLYSSNLAHLLADMGGAKSWHVDFDDAVVRGALVLYEGELTWPPPRPALPAPPPAAEKKPAAPRVAAAIPAPVVGTPKHPVKAGRSSGSRTILAAGALGVVLLALGSVAPPEFLSHLTIFILACFVGWQVIWKVTPALHTPLMSVTNAISGIILIGGMLQIAGPAVSPVVLLGAAAVLLATINVAGGFLVTQRMLRMFHK
jgi:NAD(P) transhydrogenase subunit alpha